MCTCRAAAAKNSLISNVELTEQPIEAEFLQIVLIDLNKFCFDLDLFRTRDVRLFDERID